MNAPARPRVYIIDDDPHIVEAVSLLVESVGLEAEGHCSAAQFLESITASACGCVITDVRMPGMSGLELQQQLGRDGIDLPIIVLTGFGDVPVAVRAMKQGAMDFLEKPYRPDELLEKVQKAVSEDAGQRERRRRAAETRDRLNSLTPREREVMGRIAEGAANKVVAIELGISERTVEIHRSRVMKKMGVRSLAELVQRLTQAAL